MNNRSHNTLAPLKNCSGRQVKRTVFASASSDGNGEGSGTYEARAELRR